MRRWLGSDAFPQVSGNGRGSLGGLLQAHLQTHQGRLPTGTSMKEYLAQTPPPLSICVLRRLLVDKALLAVEETPHIQPSFYQAFANA